MNVEKKFELRPFSPLEDYSTNCLLSVDEKQIVLNYEVDRGSSTLIIPIQRSKGIRQWDLWDHTCFEFFIRKKKEVWYLEFNFAPNGNWNAFYVSDYRKNEGEYGEIDHVAISSQTTSSRLTLKSTIPFSDIPLFCADDFFQGDIEVGITAVLESGQKNLEYWAINHPGDAPDFHSGFISL